MLFRCATFVLTHISALLFCAVVWADQYTTNISDLNTAEKQLYLNIRNTLNEWSGDLQKLKIANIDIIELARRRPDFLPTYIEMSRLRIMMGAVKNDYANANYLALQTLKKIQATDPTYGKAYVLSGHVYTNLGDLTRGQKATENRG